MPIYEYACNACGHRFEALQKINDDILKDCPNCHENKLKKLVSAAAFRLKGAGWYETDFKSGDKKNLLKSDNSSTSSDSKGEPANKNKAKEQKSDKKETPKNKSDS